MLNKGVKKYFEEFVECEYCKSPDTELLQNNIMYISSPKNNKLVTIIKGMKSK